MGGYNNSVTHRSQLFDTQVLDGYNNPLTHRSQTNNPLTHRSWVNNPSIHRSWVNKSSTHRSWTNNPLTHRSWVRVYHSSCEQTICVELWANKGDTWEVLFGSKGNTRALLIKPCTATSEAPKYSLSRKCRFGIITIWECSYSLQVKSVFLERALYCNR
jgi:hypothetical protein